MSEIEKEAREYCLNLILNTVLSDEYVFDPQTSHSVKFIKPRSLELAGELTKDLYPNLLCQDMEKKLAVWFESGRRKGSVQACQTVRKEKSDE
jgi:hypothetical protein